MSGLKRREFITLIGRVAARGAGAAADNPGDRAAPAPPAAAA